MCDIDDSEGYCEICGELWSDCICPECPICGEQGKLACYENHGLIRTKKQIKNKAKKDKELAEEDEHYRIEGEKIMAAEKELETGTLVNILGKIVKLATCIGCGCNDLHACPGGCSWLRVDRDAGKGVCSECKDMIDKWDSGVREIKK